MKLERIGLLIAAAGIAAAALPAAHADNAHYGHSQPLGPAALHYGSGFPALTDHEWGFALGGFGGISAGAARTHIPVIFVHGNNVDAGDWYPVRDEFKAHGWTDQELWGISYNGLGSDYGTGVIYGNPEANQERMDMGWDGAAHVTSDDRNVPDLYAFIMAVRAYTGSNKFSLVSHSLGVTLARKVLFDHKELRQDLVAFVGIAGGNHGTSFCPPGSETQVESCDEIAANTPWLDELNGPGGSDETYGPARWMTVYDGSGLGDPAFYATYAQSPALKGATNLQFPLTYHNDLRLNPSIIAVYRQFLEDTE